MAREPFILELIGITLQDYDLEVTVTGFPTTGDVYSAIVSQQPQWYEDPVFGAVFRVDDGMGYSYWRAIHNDMTISDKLQELIDIKQDIKVAIENKDVDLTGVDFGGYAGKIDLLPLPKEETEVTVSGEIFQSGDVVVTPGTGKVMAKVTVVKDTDLVPENIVKDVNIFGVVGTAETGGGGASIDRIGMICFSFYLTKGSTTTQTLSYSIASEMLNKTFFTDGEGNWYLPADVSVYYKKAGTETYKGKANTSFTIFSGAGTLSGHQVTFKVGTTPVALLLYYYISDVFGTGIMTDGTIYIGWNTGISTIRPSPNQTEFIELSGDFFDDFPYYSHSSVDYWKKENRFWFLDSPDIRCGWSLLDSD